MAAYPDLPVQGRDDLAHHPHQVLVLVRVVCEPHGLPDRQDLFADEPGVSTRDLSSRPLAGFRLQASVMEWGVQRVDLAAPSG